MKDVSAFKPHKALGSQVREVQVGQSLAEERGEYNRNQGAKLSHGLAKVSFAFEAFFFFFFEKLLPPSVHFSERALALPLAVLETLML